MPASFSVAIAAHRASFRAYCESRGDQTSQNRRWCAQSMGSEVGATSNYKSSFGSPSTKSACAAHACAGSPVFYGRFGARACRPSAASDSEANAGWTSKSRLTGSTARTNASKRRLACTCGPVPSCECHTDESCRSLLETTNWPAAGGAGNCSESTRIQEASCV